MPIFIFFMNLNSNDEGRPSPLDLKLIIYCLRQNVSKHIHTTFVQKDAVNGLDFHFEETFNPQCLLLYKFSEKSVPGPTTELA